jgi:hypothetical protein
MRLAVTLLLASLLTTFAGAAANEGKSDIDMPTIEEVKTRYEAELLELPAVVSVGIGRSPEGEKVIVVGLAKEHLGTQQALPSELHSYPVHVRVVGTPRAQ